MREPKSIGIYGASGSGKTAQTCQFAEWIYRTTGGKITRSIVTDQGGTAGVIGPHVSAGLIDPVYVGGSPMPLDWMHKLARGAWPVIGDQGEIVRWEEATGATWERVGAYVIDSGRDVAVLIKEVSNREKGVPIIRRDGASSVAKLVEGDTTIYAGHGQYFGTAQDETLALIRRFNSLPVARVLWTFGESKGEEELSGRPIYGPQTVGQAIVGVLPGQFGDLLHLESYMAPGKNAQGEQILGPDGQPQLFQFWRIYFVPHPERQTGIQFPAKPRVPAVVMPELVKAWPGGFLRPRIKDGRMEDGLDCFLEREAELTAVPARTVAEWRERVDRQGQAPAAAPAP